MAAIHLLDKSVAELIAAGEVVERPASVVKELVENSIDAGAAKVTIEIRHGGISYIRITDDGHGIARDDVPKAFLRHATSKVATAEDLSRIGTFGFRGEALASVAAMCKVELLSRTAEEAIGVRYSIQGGEQVAYEEAGCPVGTTITVRELFYNTPARMKFLKRDSTEGTNVSNVVEKMALSNPHVSFRFIKDGETKLTTPGNGDLLATIHAVMGREFASGLVQVESTVGQIAVCGYISSPKACRASRGLQNFFINGRFVKSKTCVAALEESYKSSTMVGKFPACVLNVQIPLETVDVNVHPAKIEVRFSNEKLVFDAVLTACKDALAQYERDTFALGAAIPTAEKLSPFALRDFDHRDQQQRFSAAAYRELTQESPSKSRTTDCKAEMLDTEKHPSFGQPEEQVPYRISQQRPPFPVRSTTQQGQTVHTEHTPKRVVTKQPPAVCRSEEEAAYHLEEPFSVPMNQPEEEFFTKEAVPEVRFIGELFSTYILLEYGDRLILIDKHAAHERYLFNQLKAQRGAVERQQLLTPLTVSLSKPAYAAAVEGIERYEQFGFSLEDFGEGTILVREVPVLLNLDQVPQVVEEIAEKLLDSKQDVTPEFLEDLYHSIACRSAIKGGDHSSAWELKELVRVIQEHDDIHYCPHGRPILFSMTRYEVEKRFGRMG